MTDSDLLRLAAKAAGLSVKFDDEGCCMHRGMEWIPLTDDGDALRLAVKLRLDVNQGGAVVVAERDGPKEVGVAEALGDDPYAATRRAIVRAAAEIGKAMP